MDIGEARRLLKHMERPPSEGALSRAFALKGLLEAIADCGEVDLSLGYGECALEAMVGGARVTMKVE
jgi:hypothetical protein